MEDSPIYALVMPANSATVIITKKLDTKQLFKSIYALISDNQDYECDIIQEVHWAYGKTGKLGAIAGSRFLQVWVDEEFLLKGTPQLNVGASLLTGHQLCGAVVILNGRSGKPFTAKQIEALQKASVI